MQLLKVTEITRTKKGRYSIFLDGTFYCALHADIVFQFALHAGMDIAPEQMVSLHRASEQCITKERALRLLSQRAYTEQRLYTKLCERTDPEHAACVVARMVELGLVNDADYARRFAADCVHLKGFSHRRTAQELAKKGIDRDVIDAVLEEMEEDAECAAAAIVRRKYMHRIQDEKGCAKTVHALVRLGYDHRTIRAVIANLLEDEDYYTE